jgi:hypothetical protein
MAALALNTVANIGGELRILRELTKLSNRINRMLQVAREHLEPVIVMWIV